MITVNKAPIFDSLQKDVNEARTTLQKKEKQLNKYLGEGVATAHDLSYNIQWMRFTEDYDITIFGFFPETNIKLPDNLFFSDSQPREDFTNLIGHQVNWVYTGNSNYNNKVEPMIRMTRKEKSNYTKIVNIRDLFSSFEECEAFARECCLKIRKVCYTN